MQLTPTDRRELLLLLREVVDDEGSLKLEPDQIAELDRRIDIFERMGSQGAPAATVFSQLISDLHNAPRHHH
jgi:hypothetical protein